MEMFEYAFMQRAFIVGVLLALIIPLIGVTVVLRRLSMLGDALSHTSLAGVAAGLLLNVNPVFGASVFCVGAAFGIEGIRRRFPRYAELSISVMLSAGVGLAGVLSGAWGDVTWNQKYAPLRFFDGKGVVEELLAQLRVEKVRFRPAEGDGYAFLQPGRGAEVLAGGTVLGWVGEIHPEVRDAYGIDLPVVAFELNLDALITCSRDQQAYRDFSSYPAVEMDLAIVVDEGVTCEDLERRLQSAGGKLLRGVRLFDVYRDDKRVGEGKKSMAFALTYRADDHTLTSEEVEKVHQKLVTKVCKATGGEVRA